MHSSSNMVTFTIILIGLAGAIALWRPVRNFDRRMVEAGNQRRRDAEAKAAAVPVDGPLAHIIAVPAAEGTVEYAVQLAGEPTRYRLAPDHRLPGLPAVPDAHGTSSACR